MTKYKIYIKGPNHFFLLLQVKYLPNIAVSLWEKNAQTDKSKKSEDCDKNECNQQPSNPEQCTNQQLTTWQPKTLLLFKSPWARSLEDEDFYENTINLIGQVN